MMFLQDLKGLGTESVTLGTGGLDLVSVIEPFISPEFRWMSLNLGNLNQFSTAYIYATLKIKPTECWDFYQDKYSKFEISKVYY